MIWIVRSLAALALALTLPAAGRAEDPAEKEMKALEGEYKLVKAEVVGFPSPPPGLVVRIAKGELDLCRDGEVKTKDVIKALDPSKKVKEFDLTGVEGPNKGKTVKAIYELKGGTLTICVAEEEKAARPTEFKATKVYTVLTCERLTEEEKRAEEKRKEEEKKKAEEARKKREEEKKKKLEEEKKKKK